MLEDKTLEEKLELLQRLYKVWAQDNYMRLGQLIIQSIPKDHSLYYMDDPILIEYIEKYLSPKNK